MLFSQPRSTLIRQTFFRGAMLLLFSALVSACSFAPVYSNSAGTKYNLSYADANSRLEQIVYADLVSHFGRSSNTANQHVKISVSSSSITPGSSSVGLSAFIILTQIDSEEIIFSGTRTASASFVGSPQSVANQQAANQASARAAHQLAEAIRLTLLGALALEVGQ